MGVVSMKPEDQSRFSLGVQDAVTTRAVAPGRPEHSPDGRALEEELRFTARLHHSLHPVEDVWRRFEIEGVCTAFQQFAWAAYIQDGLLAPAGATMLIVEVTEASTQRPVMLLPLIKLSHFGHSVIEWLDLGVSDYAAPILAPGLVLAPNEARAAWTAARGVLPSSDIIRVSRIPPQIFGKANPLISLRACRRMDMESFGVVLKGDPEFLIQRLCRKSTFRDFAKFRRRLERRGVVRFISAETLDEANRIFDVLLEQRRQRFREIGRVDLLAKEEIVNFYREAMHHGLNGGPARIFGLTVDGQCVATAYGLIHRDAFHLLIQTMDGGELWRNCSPGLQATAEAMKWSLAQGLSYFDFTVGMLPYKLEFGAVPSEMFEVCEVRSVRGAVIVRFAQTATATKAWLRRHPRLFEPLRESRRALRRQLNRLRNIRPAAVKIDN